MNMKKFVLILIVGALIFSGFGAGAFNIENEAINNENEQTGERATHTVLGEYGTATWCGYCNYAHGALKELYAEGQLDFYYVSLVCDKNSASQQRASQYNLYGYPTVWWDGGFDVDVGAGSVPAAKATYTTSINSASNRDVYDVLIDLEVKWLDGTEIQVDCEVTNNEGSTYDGTIRVYITDKVSSMGWRDTGGELYTYCLLDWAFNEEISITSGGSWSDSMTWDGATNGFPNITPENTWVIAAVFNDEVHQGYSYPPSSNPFDAYYPDCVVGTGPTENQQPDQPTVSGPTDGDPGVDLEYTIEITDPDEDNLRVWIEWGDESQGWLGPYPSGSVLNIMHQWAEAGIYEVKVKTMDDKYEESAWSEILTVSIGNLIPNKPEITGPSTGAINTEIEFTFVATDPNNHDLYYYIDWGDGTIEEWTGPVISGDEVKLSHTWTQDKGFAIKAKVKDTEDDESGFTTHVITIPRSKFAQNYNFGQLFERFSMIFKIIKNILG